MLIISLFNELLSINLELNQFKLKFALEKLLEVKKKSLGVVDRDKLNCFDDSQLEFLQLLLEALVLGHGPGGGDLVGLAGRHQVLLRHPSPVEPLHVQLCLQLADLLVRPRHPLVQRRNTFGLK